MASPKRRKGSGGPSSGSAGPSRGSSKGPSKRGAPKPGQRSSGRKRPSGGSKPGRRPPAGRGPRGDRTGRAGGDRGLGGDQVEGRQAIRELLLAGTRRTNEILFASDLDPAPVLDEIRQLAQEARVVVREIGRGRLESLARSEAPQGVIARAAPLRVFSLDDLLGDFRGRTPFLLVLDHVTDPGNLGAILRTAECAGVTGVVMPRHRAARVTPTVAKAAAGAIEHLRIAQVGGVASAMQELNRSGIWSVGLDAGGERSIFELAPPPGAVALVLGAEGTGLSRLVAERASTVAAIPITGNTESLNVAAAAAIATYQLQSKMSAV